MKPFPKVIYMQENPDDQDAGAEVPSGEYLHVGREAGDVAYKTGAVGVYKLVDVGTVTVTKTFESNNVQAAS